MHHWLNGHKHANHPGSFECFPKEGFPILLWKRASLRQGCRDFLETIGTDLQAARQFVNKPRQFALHQEIFFQQGVEEL